MLIFFVDIDSGPNTIGKLGLSANGPNCDVDSGVPGTPLEE